MQKETDYLFDESASYDKKDKYSIEQYGQGMVGKTFYELCLYDTNNSLISEPENEYFSDYENRRRKGSLGQLVEERFFHYKVNSDSAPDFSEAGVELKVTPYKINKNKSISAKERLVLNIIDYNSVAFEINFYESHFWYKNQLILLVYYLWKEGIDRLQYQINFVRLFTPNDADLTIIKNDYSKIVEKIREGKAHELSESDTFYLSACTKGANADDVREQPFSSIKAKQRAFAYKTTFMTYVLNAYIIKGRPLFESIVKKEKIDDFEEFVISKINKYKGKTFYELIKYFDIGFPIKAKNIGAMIAFRILGIKGNNAEEFVKANIKVKTIRINKQGKIKENMSFPVFKFTDLVEQDWEDSDFYELLSSTKFLFVIYREDEKNEYRLDHAQFWNMPYEDLENEVRVVWEKTKMVLENLPSELKENGHFKSIFPKQSENRISHVRPHAANSKDTYPLPDGREYPKQCFWLNNSYILSVINNK